MAKKRKPSPSDQPFGAPIVEETDEPIELTETEIGPPPPLSEPTAAPPPVTDSALVRQIEAHEAPRGWRVRHDKVIKLNGMVTRLRSGTVVTVEEWGERNVQILREFGVELEPI